MDYLRQLVGEGIVIFVYIPTAFMRVDVLTKGEPKEKVEFCSEQMGGEQSHLLARES